MRVALFSNSRSWGGLEAHVVALVEALQAANHEVVLGCIGDRAFDLYRTRVPGPTKLVDLGSPEHRSGWHWWRSLCQLEADAAVLEKGTLWTGSLALDCVLRLKFRRYVVVQQLEPPELPPRTSGRYLRGMIPGLALWWHRWKWSGYLRSLAPTMTICVSDSVRRRLRDDYRFSGHRLITVHNGVDPERFRPDPEARRRVRREWCVPEDAFVFGSVGRLTYQKGLEFAIEAFARIERETLGRSLFLVLVGEGAEQPKLARLRQELGVEHRVLLPGFMADPRDAYQAFDVFMIPSRFEGLPFALLEAMATGCRVIGTRVGGVPEVVSDPSLGILIPQEDPAALRAAMNEMLVQHADSRATSKRIVIEHVARHFSIRPLCSRIVSLIESGLPDVQRSSAGSEQTIVDSLK